MGPCSVLRVIATARNPDAPLEVTAIGSVDIMLDDVCCRFSEVAHATYGRRAGGYHGEAPPCGPVDLARAVWAPFAPDVLVAHDLPAQLQVFPRAITGVLPWISTLRVARTAWHCGWTSSPVEILAARRLNDLGVKGNSKAPFRAVVREALQVASLVEGMVASVDVRQWSITNPSAAHALRPALGELAADYALQGMLDMSAVKPAPMSRLYWPGPWDNEEAWRAPLLDDLDAYAESAEDDSQGMAMAEVRRRTVGLDACETLTHTPVLIRRKRFDDPEEGRCDRW